MSNTPPRPSKANVQASSASSASPSARVQNNDETKSREISSEFRELLDKARSEDFSDLTRCGCVQVGLKLILFYFIGYLLSIF